MLKKTLLLSGLLFNIQFHAMQSPWNPFVLQINHMQTMHSNAFALNKSLYDEWNKLSYTEKQNYYQTAGESLSFQGSSLSFPDVEHVVPDATDSMFCSGVTYLSANAFFISCFCADSDAMNRSSELLLASLIAGKICRVGELKRLQQQFENSRAKFKKFPKLLKEN